MTNKQEVYEALKKLTDQQIVEMLEKENELVIVRGHLQVYQSIKRVPFSSLSQDEKLRRAKSYRAAYAPEDYREQQRQQNEDYEDFNNQMREYGVDPFE